MSLRAALVVAALLAQAALVTWAWSQKSLLQSERQASASLAQQLDAVQAQARDTLAIANTLKSTLANERQSLVEQLKLMGELRLGVADRQRQIEDLKRENEDLRQWADQPLPAAARGLRERPAITGADAYRDWLSRSGAVRPAGDGADEQREPAR